MGFPDIEPGTGRRIAESNHRFRFTRLEWRGRLDAAGALDKIELALETTDEASQSLRIALKKAKDDLLSSDYVDVRDARTVAGVYGLFAMGFITAEQRDALLTPRM